MNTEFYRDHDGWNGKTAIDIGSHRELTIHTHKRGIGGGLATSASVSTVNANGTKTHVFGFSLGRGDYSSQLLLTQPNRITEKYVRLQHLNALALIDEIKFKVNAHYVEQERLASNDKNSVSKAGR